MVVATTADTASKKTVGRRILMLLLIVAVSLTVRSLTAYFLSNHLDDPGWFPGGIYSAFDRPAQKWLDGDESIFWIDDASQTDKAVYPPGYPLWVASIYSLTGVRSAQAVQNVQWVLDSFSVLLIVGAGVTGFGWRTGLYAGWIAALWPLLATYGAIPLADAPTSWVIVGGTWMLLLAVKRQNIGLALLAGALVGGSCWMRANAMFLVIFWALAILLLVRESWPQRAILGLSVVSAAMLVISPVVVRNSVTFQTFVPTGLGAGTNLLEGLGEDERGEKEFGAVKNDIDLLEQERLDRNVRPGERFDLYYPDGVQRDRERARRGLAIIEEHPFWYASTVVDRMAAVMKFAGEPSGVYGSAGINVTSKKSLPREWQNGILALFVRALGMAQSVLRYVLLPLILIGVILGFRTNWRTAGLLMATVLYYFVVGSMIHTHIRYGLPMYALLTIFAGNALWRLKDLAVRRKFLLPTGPEHSGV